MIEKGFKGNLTYKLWLAFLLALTGNGIFHYLHQLQDGLGVTGMGRDISWGYYISNFLYADGLAAATVVLIIPYYLHNFKKFSKVVLFGEWISVAGVVMCVMFVMADMGQPGRAMNIVLHPTPGAVLFWDFNVLMGFLVIMFLIAWNTLRSEQSGFKLPGWVKTLILISIPWAFAMQMIAAFLISGLPGRHLWLTAIMGPRFLASAFASGPAFLIIVFYIIKKATRHETEPEAISLLSKIMLYAMITNIFFYGLEFFTAYYSNIPDHKESLQYLFFGLEGHDQMVPWVRTSAVLGILAVTLLLFTRFRNNENLLAINAMFILISTFIDKGIALIIGGFIPSTLGHVTEYSITLAEFSITLGIWAIGFLLMTIFFKMTLEVRK